MRSGADEALAGVRKLHPQVHASATYSEPLGRAQSAAVFTQVHERGGSHRGVHASFGQVRTYKAHLRAGAQACRGAGVYGGRPAMLGRGLATASDQQQCGQQRAETRQVMTPHAPETAGQRKQLSRKCTLMPLSGRTDESSSENEQAAGTRFLDNPCMTDPVLTLCQVPAEAGLWLWTDEEEESIDSAVHEWRDARLTVRTVRGSKMRTEPQLFDEFAAALQFPAYFGENWSALDDCLTDLAWLPPEAGYVLVVTQPLHVLEASPDSLPILVRQLTSACTAWSAPVALGEWWDRPGLPFHTVLATSLENEAQVRARWKSAEARLSDLPV